MRSLPHKWSQLPIRREQPGQETIQVRLVDSRLVWPKLIHQFHRKTENLMRQLKRMESTLDTLMHSISHPGLTSIPTGTVTRSPTPSSPSVAASNNARTLLGSPSASTPDLASSTTSSLQKPREKPRSSSPRLHMLPDNTLNPLGLLAEASLQNRREKGASSGLGGMLPGNINEDDGAGKVEGRPVGVASDAYFKPGVSI